MHAPRTCRLWMAAATMIVLLQGQSATAAITGQETKCLSTMAKSLQKLNSATIKEISRCRAGDISGEAADDDACATLPAANQARVDKAADKFISSVAKACKSTCSLSDDIPCINNVGCPPNNANSERCSGKGGTKPFNINRLGFPGPYCESILLEAKGTERFVLPSDAGTCLAPLARALADDVIETLYADLDETSGLSEDAQSCLAGISKATGKVMASMHAAMSKCRTSRVSDTVCAFGGNVGNECATNTDCGGSACGLDPDGCTTDEDVLAALTKARTSLSSSIDKACDDSEILELDGLCAAAGLVPASVAAAQDCIGDALEEIAAAHNGPRRHTFAPFGMINLTHPDSAFGYCGDGQLDQKRNESNWIGEECDGDDNDEACGSGSCLPPGDLFECTCDNNPRYRMVVDGEAVDSDAGWKGDSHDATHNDGFGYTADLSNCDCSSFSQATCASATDAVCDMAAVLGPRCTNNRNSAETCDEIGDGDGDIEDSDCFVCDPDSLNAGTFCADSEGEADETVCNSQCFNDETGAPVVPAQPCGRQADCDEGETCKGRCDDTPTCDKLLEGSPLPLVSAAVPVCIGLEYTSDLTGTKNMVTGEAEIFYTSRSVVHIGDSNLEPCPTCGGVCIGGGNDGDGCSGRCNVSGNVCLLDEDCTSGGDTTCLESAADCPGGTCSLDLKCSKGARAGEFCRPMSSTALGVVSADCPPSASSNLSGFGVQQPFGAVTTEPLTFPAGIPCSSAEWTNFTCPCPDGGSQTKTQPNSCAFTCNAGPNEGKSCGATNNDIGAGTRCAGGADAGELCDENADCSLSTCTANPFQCTAGGAGTLGMPCIFPSQCDTSMGSGDGICSDSCPTGICLPLCSPQGVCNGGPRDGLECAVSSNTEQCGGSPCVVTDPEDGLCTNGPLKWRCTGAGFTTLPCLVQDEGTQTGCEAGLDGMLGNTDDIPGAGYCENRPMDCYINNGATEGWDTLNGNGDASDVKLVSTFCTPPSGNEAVNAVSGFGGPSRTRRFGQGYVNVPSIP